MPKTEYVDHVRLVSKEKVAVRDLQPGVVGLLLREFKDGRCKLYVHIGLTLVSVDEAPKSDIDRLYKTLDKLKDKYKVTWKNE